MQQSETRHRSPTLRKKIALGGSVCAVLGLALWIGPSAWESSQEPTVSHAPLPESDSDQQRRITDRLPVFKFEVTRRAGDREWRKIEQLWYVQNTGDGPAYNVTITKSPLPGDREARAVSAEGKRLKPPSQTIIPVIEVDDGPHLVFREGLEGGETKVTVYCKNVYGDLIYYDYAGHPFELRMTNRRFLNTETGDKKSF